MELKRKKTTTNIQRVRFTESISRKYSAHDNAEDNLMIRRLRKVALLSRQIVCSLHARKLMNCYHDGTEQFLALVKVSLSHFNEKTIIVIIKAIIIILIKKRTKYSEPVVSTSQQIDYRAECKELLSIKSI